MTIWLLTFLLLIVSVITIHIKKTTSYWKRRNIIGPTPVPIFGNIKEGVLRKKHLATIYQEIYNAFPNEKVVGVYTMTSPALLIRDLEIAKQILVKDFNCFSDRGLRISKEKLGDSLFHCDSRTWRALRGKLTPYFSSGKLRSSFNAVTECGDTFVEYIENETSNSSEIELHHLFNKFAIDAILTGIFNLKIGTYSERNKDYFKNLDKSIFIKSYLNEVSMLFPDFMNITNTSIFGKTAVKFCYDIVNHAKNKKNKTSGNKFFIDMLIDLKNDENISDKNERNEGAKFKITDSVIASQVLIIFAAGYENTNLCLSYAFYYLANNIYIQDRLIEEIDKILTRHNGVLSYEALNEMNYLEKVFKETLRIQPFSTTLQRVAHENYTIPGTNIEIEKDTTVLISPLAFHRDKRYYDEPLKFDPERFNLENVRNRDACSFLAFGLGPRSCFGYRFTKLLFKVATVKILSKFIVRPFEKTTIKEIDPYRTMLAMKGGVHVKLLPRKTSEK